MNATEANRAKKTLAGIAHWLKAMGEILSLVRPRDRVLVVIGLFVSSVFELLGLTMIIPLLATVSGAKQSKLGLTEKLQPLFESVGLPFHPAMFMVAIVVLLLIKSAISILVMRYVSLLVGEVGSEFRLKLIKSLMRAQWGYFIQMPLGRLTHATGPESSAIGECFLTIASLLSGMLQALAFLTIAALLSWKLAALTVAVGIFMLLSFGQLMRHSRKIARRHRQQMRALATSFTDALVGIKPIRAMGRTDRFSQMFEKDARRLAKSTRKQVNMSEFTGELQEPIIGAGLVFGFYYGTHTLELSFIELFIAAILLVKTIGVLSPMQKNIQKFLAGHDQYRSLTALLAQAEGAAEPSSGTLAATFERDLRFEAVDFGYGPHPVLNELDLTIAKGRITTIAGPSGVGKSTILDLLVGLYRPQAGRILIDGVDLRDIDLKAWRSLIGYVPQETTLFHDTIRNNLSLWAPEVTDEQITAALKLAGAWDFVDSRPGGLDHVVGERGHRLSGGQRQRISLARALVFKPKLLVLDEATTGLDPETEAGICDEVRKLCRETGLTVLAISHQPRWQDIADKVHYIEPGGQAWSDEDAADDGAYPEGHRDEMESLGAVAAPRPEDEGHLRPDSTTSGPAA